MVIRGGREDKCQSKMSGERQNCMANCQQIKQPRERGCKLKMPVKMLNNSVGPLCFGQRQLPLTTSTKNGGRMIN